MISEIAQRRWRLGLFFGALDLGRCPGVAPGCYGPGLWPADFGIRISDLHFPRHLCGRLS